MPKTPYQMKESEQSSRKPRENYKIFTLPNPAELKEMDEKSKELFKAYEGKKGVNLLPRNKYLYKGKRLHFK